MESCSHPACTCEHDRSDMVEKDGRHYCNEACSIQDPDKGGCDCGHAQCEG